MTNPTLERAARALCAHNAVDPDAILGSGEAVWEIYVGDARAVLMAVLPDEVDVDNAPGWMDSAQAYGWWCGFNACRQAVLNDGEGE